MSTHFRDISDALHRWYYHVRWKHFKSQQRGFLQRALLSFAVNINFLCSFMTNSCKEMRRRRGAMAEKIQTIPRRKGKRNKWKVGKKMSNISDKTETSACDQLQEEQTQEMSTVRPCCLFTKTIHLLISTQTPEMFLAEGQFFHSSS